MIFKKHKSNSNKIYKIFASLIVPLFLTFLKKKDSNSIIKKFGGRHNKIQPKHNQAFSSLDTINKASHYC